LQAVVFDWQLFAKAWTYGKEWAMRSFFAAAAMACGVSLFLWAAPANAQRYYGGGWRAGGVYRGGWYGGYRGYYGGYRTYGYGWRGYGAGVYGPYYGWGYGYSPYYYGYSPYNYGYPTYASVYTRYNYMPDLYYSTPMVAGPSSIVRQSFYAPTGTSNQATVRVLLPDANAKVTFDDTATTQTGTDRVFNTPALDPAKSYSYTVQATWMEGDKEVTRKKDVRIAAGANTTVDFRTPGNP
jgi:uncharacterized protein (TIGR03000 family)